MLCAVLEDFEAQDDGPKIIVGDFNASISNLPSLERQIQCGNLLDLGSFASMYGGVDNDTTCKAQPEARATRKDYAMANPCAYDIIDKFEIDHDSLIPVHDIIRIIFKGSRPRKTYQAV